MGVEGVGTPPYRIETGRLVLRCWSPADAPLLKDAVDRSVEHLRPWMPWTPDTPEELGVVVQRLRAFRAEFDAEENWIYGILSPDESRVLGGTGLHPRGGPGSLEIGYWVAADALRQGIATEITAVLTRVAVEICGVDRVDVRVEPRNEASARIPGKLGFTYEGTLRRRLPRREGQPRGDAMVFSMLREELAASPCADYEYAAFDVVGNRVLPESGSA